MKNIWFELSQEMMKSQDYIKELTELLLICKILDTLPDEYFAFKSSWMLMSKEDRTVENLTSQLCAHERALTCKNSGEVKAEALVVKNDAAASKNIVRKKKYYNRYL